MPHCTPGHPARPGPPAGTKLRAGRAACLALLATALPATAQEAAPAPVAESPALAFAATPAVVSDYVFRGLSQTRGRPAAQLILDAEHRGGLYLGAFASNVALAGTNARQELDLLAGYRFGALGLRWDIGAVYYGYPGFRAAPGAYRIDWLEGAARAAAELGPVRLSAALHVSPDFQAQSGTGVHLEGGADLSLPHALTLSGRLGRQWIGRNARFGTPDYLWWSAALAWRLGPATLSLAYHDTDVARADCLGGQKVCGARAVLGLALAF